MTKLHAINQVHRWPALPFVLAEGTAVPGSSLEEQGQVRGAETRAGWLESVAGVL